ncbi:MAG: amidohydrolase, partial [Propionibacteriaceae bacterium]|jgi:hippurate hydrolase|nr:amidohydrolase [Propionibacteriaceae bacterium]
VAEKLTTWGYEVLSIGGGVVGVLRNGEGPVVLTRADMDALPVVEATGLPYASTVTDVDEDGRVVGVMHACGHDVHITTQLGAAELLAAHPEAWSGTYISLFQPAEETVGGAQGMVDAGLVAQIPKPDVAYGQHVFGIKAGHVATHPGPTMSASDSIRVTVWGKGTHGSAPHQGVDPIVLAAAIVLRLQGIVAREVKPGTTAVVTVGSLQAGTKSNIIGDTAVLYLNTRAYSEEVRATLHAAIERIIRAECTASGSPREPEFVYYDQTPLTDNDPAETETIRQAFTAHFGAEAVEDLGQLSGSEDFGQIPDAFGTPYVYWGLGGFENPDTAPANHSALFAPVIQPTLEVGTRAYVVAVLTHLAR